ncbi:hypothetical protein BM1374166_01775 [Bartonella tribocorum]|nr:hypothetical protein BM1374166_01775 [Bartonella tribocorum]
MPILRLNDCHKRDFFKRGALLGIKDVKKYFEKKSGFTKIKRYIGKSYSLMFIDMALT